MESRPHRSAVTTRWRDVLIVFLACTVAVGVVMLLGPEPEPADWRVAALIVLAVTVGTASGGLFGWLRDRRSPPAG